MRTEIVVVNKVSQTATVILSDSDADRRDRLVDSGECLGGCGKPAAGGTRGACKRCYAATRRAIAQGKTSEAELVRRGLLLPAGKTGRRTSNPMAKRIDGEQ